MNLGKSVFRKIFRFEGHGFELSCDLENARYLENRKNEIDKKLEI